MKRAWAAVLTTALLLVGGVALSAPAEAGKATVATYNVKGRTVDPRTTLRAQLWNGSWTTIRYGTAKHHVVKVCPRKGHYIWIKRNGNPTWYKRNKCVATPVNTIYHVRLYKYLYV